MRESIIFHVETRGWKKKKKRNIIGKVVFPSSVKILARC